MKLVILIPAYNEEKQISDTIQSIPKKIPGCSDISILVVNDGSTDRTVEMAMNAGADKIVSHKINAGVGAAFMTGVRNAISMKADILVTFDADSQFDPKQIVELIVPIINEQFDVVIGSRFLNGMPKMPKIKYFGNKIFSKIVSTVTNQKFTDTQTGFRAYSSNALKNITVINEFTYTQEVLIDLKFKRFRIGEIPVKVTYDEKRKSRVVKSIFSYSYRAISIITKSVLFHRPFLAFGLIGMLLIGGGMFAKILTITKVLGVTSGLSTGLLILGIVSFMLGILANMVFRRQEFAEKGLRYYVEEFDNSKK